MGAESMATHWPPEQATSAQTRLTQVSREHEPIPLGVPAVKLDVGAGVTKASVLCPIVVLIVVVVFVVVTEVVDGNATEAKPEFGEVGLVV